MEDWWKKFLTKYVSPQTRESLFDAWTRIRELRPVRGIMIIAFLIIIFVVGNQGCQAVRNVNALSDSNKILVQSREAVVLTGDIMTNLLMLQGRLQVYTLDLRNRAYRDSVFETARGPDGETSSTIFETLIDQKIVNLNLLDIGWKKDHLPEFAQNVRLYMSRIDTIGIKLTSANLLLNQLSNSGEDTILSEKSRTNIEQKVARIISQVTTLNLNCNKTLAEINSAYLILKLDWETEIKNGSEINESLANQTLTQAALVSLLLVMLFLMLLVVIINDLNRNREMQARLENEKDSAQTLAEVKQRFLANMSHEIRNPLHAIIGFAQQLAQTELARNQRHLLKPLQRSARYLLALINDVLDFSKIDSNNLQLEETGFSLADVFEEVDSTFRSAAQKKEIDFETSIDKDIPPVVIGDSLRLKQMLLNLVGNALKFTEKGTVGFVIRSRQIATSKVSVEFEISDTGIGIPADIQQQIFSEWSQADTKTTRRYGGTGLGLAITTKLTELYQGKLELESREGEGTTFRLIIPFKLGTEQDLEITHIQEGTEETSWKGKRVLVADDEPFNRVLMEILLQKMEIDPDMVENGAEALGKLQQNEYDLVLLDLQMPEMDGFEVARKTREEISKDLPLIAVTATATKKEADLATQAGMNEILLKPFEEKDLKRVLAKYFPEPEEA